MLKKLKKIHIGLIIGTVASVFISLFTTYFFQDLFNKFENFTNDMRYKWRYSPEFAYPDTIQNWLPNEDAVLYFAEHIFPQIRSRYPNDLFTIVGRRPSDKVRRLGQIAGIHVTGTVDDVRPYYAGATALVVPLRIGGGSRLKILEAMSAGVPVLSTTIGCEGLDVQDNEHLLIADEPDLFAEKTLELLSRQELQTRLSNNARTRVELKSSWASMADRLAALYDALASLRRRAQATTPSFSE